MSALKFNGACDTCARPLMGAVDCGGTGYSTDTKLGLRHCYVCCADRDRAYMRKHGRIDLYLTGGKAMHFGLKSDGKPWCITNWPNSLKFTPSLVRGSYGYGFGRRYDRYDVWFTFEGRRWHGVNAGDSQILRCKQTKGA